MKSNTKSKKSDIINLRVSAEDKQSIQQKAFSLGMTLSQYMLHCAMHEQINVVEGGREIAKRLYDTYEMLNKIECLKKIDVPSERNNIHVEIAHLNDAMKEGI